jgi:hypothetical protein
MMHVIPHDNLLLIVIDQDGEAMAATHETPLHTWVLALRHGEAAGRDAVGRVKNRIEDYWCCVITP